MKKAGPPPIERLAIRAPNHLGELLLALPALQAACEKERRETGTAPVVQVVSWLVPLVAMADLDARLLPLSDRRDIAAAARELRTYGVRRGILLTPSVSSALIFRAAGLTARRGTGGGGRGWLLTDVVDRAPLLEDHRVKEFLAIADLPVPEGEPPAPRLAAIDAARAAWSERRRAERIPPDGRRLVALFPGANGTARRWPVDKYAALARSLAGFGHRVLVLGGPEDRPVTEAVVGRALTDDGTLEGSVLDLGGRTSLVELAGALDACHLLVTNDTGPMHVAAALDRPIVAVEGPADVRQTRPLATRVRLVGRFDLPCVPCVKNECPRGGRGTILESAERECLRLVTVDEVLEASLASLEEAST
ncbi:MAG: lipopolysaccharide heptosyltransferase II [marine benthic group bacterium]|nr:lipopolysaccharide heptosyltransferase II [Gemmatimonadota bacterium]MCL7963534.1 lipopolysaccharide heptosyltransferase II [Candidatus Carthagonibacter metallireducens]MCL7967614.1 lipopolysaccharide heptosyltransferase II [Gemmatimonadota bacterium]MCL7968983.1 lipopolysaccharide heptosyltransferase II [Gemmatimonadota bacterium]MCL7981311.1 lipopolysaccharide heptosyltransferase II [Gemmatimonadota bacterium]